MGKPRKTYTKEEKLKIVQLSLEEGESVKDLAERYSIKKGTLYGWRSAYLKDKENAFPGNGNPIESQSERQIKELKKQLREVELERDILKKAVGIFSRNDRKFSNL